MKEQLISFETAKLAKEKGFDITINKLYDIKGNLGSINCNNKCHNFSAPTQSLLQKWLREKHEIHININTFYFTDIDKFGYEVEDIVSPNESLILSGTQGDYEEALEKGLQEALKLIE